MDLSWWPPIRDQLAVWILTAWDFCVGVWTWLSVNVGGFFGDMPDYDLPDVPDWPVTIVIATTLLALSLSGLFSGWAERRISWQGLFAFIVAAGLFFWVWEADRTKTWRLIPEAFVEVAARILR